LNSRGLNQQLKIVYVVVSIDLIQHVFDETASGYVKGYINIGENVNEPTRFAVDIELTEKMKKAFRKNR
jgi:nucleoside phosphorylase